MHYVGAGSSGRIAVVDAAELIPTLGLEPGRVVAHIAGGAPALTRPAEAAEDDEDAGTAAVHDVAAGDLVIGVTAGGRTPYVRAALATARAKEARPSSLRWASSVQPAASALNPPIDDQ